MSLDEKISLVVQAIGSEFKNAYTAINSNSQAIANLATAQGQFGKTTPLVLSTLEQNLDFEVIVPTTDAAIFNFDDLNNRIDFLVDTSFNFKTDMNFGVNVNSERIVTIRGRNAVDNSEVYSRTVSINQGNNTSKSVSTNTLLILGKNGVPSSPFTIYFTIQCSGAGITLSDFDTLLTSGSGGLTNPIDTIETLSTTRSIDVTKRVTFIDVTLDSTFTLPSAVNNIAAICNIKRVDYTSKRVVINTITNQTIDGNLYVELVPFQSINIVSNGTNWFII